MGLTLLALLVLFPLGIIVAAVPVVLIGQIAPGLATFLAGCAAAALTVWLLLRFSLAMPMAYAKARFVLGESWKMTAGLGWKLFGVAACMVAIIFGLELAILIPTLAILAVTGELKEVMASLQAGYGATYPAAAIAAYVVIVPILSALLNALMAAPWASIYQQLAGPEPDPVS